MNLPRTLSRTFWTAAFLAASASGADLAQVDRSLAKPPKTTTNNVRYGLFAVGPQAQARAWLVVDGRKAYLDRNGDGDLSGPGESLEAVRDPETKQEPDEQGYREFVGEIQIPGQTDGAGKPVAYRVELSMLSEAGSFLTIKSAGREQVCYPNLASTPAEAPIVHLGGPLEILVLDGQLARTKKGTDLRVHAATPGLGKNADAALANDSLDPAIRPELEIEFPAEKGSEPLRVKLPLAERCCGSLFHGHVPVPARAGDGKARVTISFPAWKDGPPPRTFELPLAERK